MDKGGTRYSLTGLFQEALVREGRDFRGYGFYPPHIYPKSDAMKLWLLKNPKQPDPETGLGVRALRNRKNGTISGGIVADCCLKA